MVSLAIKQAVDHGMQIGFEKAAFERCDGKDFPDERCPVPPKDGCVCAYVYWRNLPWYKRMFRAPPPRPDVDQCLWVIVASELEKLF